MNMVDRVWFAVLRFFGAEPNVFRATKMLNKSITKLEKAEAYQRHQRDQMAELARLAQAAESAAEDERQTARNVRDNLAALMDRK